MNTYAIFKKALDKIEGESANGFWSKRQFIGEMLDDKRSQLCFTLFGDDKVKMLDGLQPDSLIKIHYTPQSREVTTDGTSRWYTELNVYRVEKANG